jgi:hypothetical protein
VGSVILLIVAIMVGVGLIIAAVLVPLFRRWQRGEQEFLIELRAGMAKSGERMVVEPESAVYRGASAHYGAVKGNGKLLLTDRRLVFRKLTGGTVEVDVARITGTRTSPSFLGSRVGGQTHLIVETTDPAEVGFFVTDLTAWQQRFPGGSQIPS